jgi:hypothetical protein
LCITSRPAAKKKPRRSGASSFAIQRSRLTANLRTGHIAKRVAHTTALAQGWPAFAFDHDLIAVAVIGSCTRANRSTNASANRRADRPADRETYTGTDCRTGRCAADRVGIGACHVRRYNKSCKGYSSHQCFPHLFVSFVSL